MSDKSSSHAVKPVGQLVPRFEPNQYLRLVVLALVCMVLCNLLYSIGMFEFDPRQDPVLAPEDRFADLVKFSLSFRNVTAGIESTKKFQSWEPIYKFYYAVPCYGGRESLAQGGLTHFHAPPFSALLFMLCGLFISWTGIPSLAIWLFFILYLLAVWWMISVGVPRDRRTKLVLFVVWFICLVTYPALLILSRANYIDAGFTSIFIIGFLLAVFGRRRMGSFVLLGLAMAVNIKPNAIIFALALPLALGIRQAIKPFLGLVAIASGIVGLSYLAANHLYPDYTIPAFLKGLQIYNELYVAGPMGDRANSSLFAMVKNLNTILHFGISFRAIVLIFGALSLSLVTALCFGWSMSGRSSLTKAEGLWAWGKVRWPVPVASFFLVSFYCLLSPVFADYHLLVFCAPLLLVFFSHEQWQTHARLLSVVAMASILLLAPKNYVFLSGLSLQTIANPAILYFSTLWLAVTLENGPRLRDDLLGRGAGANPLDQSRLGGSYTSTA